jgi:hypothetical protein
VYNSIPGDKCVGCWDAMAVKIQSSTLASFTETGNVFLDEQQCSFECARGSQHSDLISVSDGFRISGGEYAGAKTYFSDTADTVCAWFSPYPLVPFSLSLSSASAFEAC